MARFIWAKAYVDMLRHPKIVGRPDCDVRLWVGLILHAREHCPDGVVRDLTPEDMRGQFGIKAPLRSVRDGLAYFRKKGMLVEVSGGLLIKDFVDRQKADSGAERQARWRDGNQRHPVTENGNDAETNDVTKRYAERLAEPLREPLRALPEGEKEKEEDLHSGRGVHNPSRARGDEASQKALSPEPWPELLLEKLRLYATKTLGLQEERGAWPQFVATTIAEPAWKRVGATTKFFERGHDAARKPLHFLGGMIKSWTEADATARVRPPVNSNGSFPPGTNDDHAAEERAEEAARRRV